MVKLLCEAGDALYGTNFSIVNGFLAFRAKVEPSFLYSRFIDPFRSAVL